MASEWLLIFLKWKGGQPTCLVQICQLMILCRHFIQKPDLLAISASMSSNVLKTKKLIKAVRSSQALDTKIIVGGYLFNRVPDLWKQVGADYYAENAEKALRIANQSIIAVIVLLKYSNRRRRKLKMSEITPTKKICE